jgi:hypothetical protein
MTTTAKQNKQNTRWNKQNPPQQDADLNPTMSMITLNINGSPNISLKGRDYWTELEKK